MKTRKKTLFICTIQAFLTALAFCSATTPITDNQALILTDGSNPVLMTLAKLQLNYLGSYNINTTLTFLIFAYFFYLVNKKIERPNKRLSVITSIGGLLFTIFVTIGNKFLYNSQIFYSNLQIFITSINTLGYFFLFKNVLTFFILLVGKIKNQKDQLYKPIKKFSNFKFIKVIKTFKQKHPIVFFSIAFLLCWSPYLIIFYPGTMNVDSLNEINQFFRIDEWTTHHPVFPTMVFGNFMNIGRFLVNDNFGLFLNNISQVIAFSIVLSYAINYIFNFTKNRNIVYIIFAFFAFLPTWPVHFYTEVKDIWYSLFFFIYVLFSMKFIELNGKLSKKQWICYIISMIFTYLFRNNGIFIILFTFPFLAILVKKLERKKIICFSLLAIIISISFTKICTFTLGIKKGEIAESLSIPLQQTALYLNSYEVTEEEAKNIDKIIDIQKFKENYMPEMSDSIKVFYKDTATSEDLKNYLITWFKMFIKHPNIYLKATLNCTYGYFYPNKLEYKDGIAQFTIDITDEFAHFNKSNLNLHPLEKTSSIRDSICFFVYTLRNTPFIGLLFSCGFYNWILLGLTLILIYYKKKRNLVVLVPLYVTFLICIASPVNSYVRYMLPTMLALPFTTIWTIYYGKNKENKIK